MLEFLVDAYIKSFFGENLILLENQKKFLKYTNIILWAKCKATSISGSYAKTKKILSFSVNSNECSVCCAFDANGSVISVKIKWKEAAKRLAIHFSSIQVFESQSNKWKQIVKSTGEWRRQCRGSRSCCTTTTPRSRSTRMEWRMRSIQFWRFRSIWRRFTMQLELRTRKFVQQLARLETANSWEQQFC